MMRFNWKQVICAIGLCGLAYAVLCVLDVNAHNLGSQTTLSSWNFFRVIL